MARRLLNFVTFLSLLLCLGLGVLWPRSYWVEDELDWGAGRREGVWYTVKSYLGGVHVARWVEPRGLFFHPTGYRRSPVSYEYGLDNERLFPPHWADAYPITDSWFDGWGFAAGHGSMPIFGLRSVAVEDFSPGDRSTRVAVLVVPHWFLLALTALPAAVRALGWVRRRGRARRGLCAACGYDLRATPGRCPECGAAAGARDGAEFS